MSRQLGLEGWLSPREFCCVLSLPVESLSQRFRRWRRDLVHLCVRQILWMVDWCPWLVTSALRLTLLPYSTVLSDTTATALHRSSHPAGLEGRASHLRVYNCFKLHLWRCPQYQ